MRERSGSIRTRGEGRAEKVYARITWVDESGRLRSKEKLAKNRTEAKALKKKMIRELDDHGTETLDYADRTFAEFAAWFNDRYMQPAKIVDGRKVSGLRSYKQSRYLPGILVNYFGTKKLRSIKASDIEQFKNDRLDTPIEFVNGKGEVTGRRERSIASVNRPLALLSKMFNSAVAEGWLLKSPMPRGVIKLSDESPRRRTRVLSVDEESRLLAACTGLRAHLRPMLIALLDTGMRYSEMTGLVWNDVNLEHRRINIKATNTKTQTARMVMISDRLVSELTTIWEHSAKDGDTRVFGTANVKRSFAGARKDAKLADFRLHDCRHTCGTRLVQGGLSLAETSKILGHATFALTYSIYVNLDETTLDRAQAALAAHN